MNRTARFVAAIAVVAGALLTGCSGEPGPNGTAPADGLSVSIDKIGAASSLVPVGLNADKTLEVPPLDQVQQAAYYSGGPMPGDVGPAVIVGHVNGNGRPGVFSRLDELKAGDKVTVTRDGRALTFTVNRMQTIDKGKFPTAAVYSDVAGPELRIITCGGDLDRSAKSYKSNVIAFATLDA